ncbi:MAG: Mur ligase domain-containing protein, partial [Fimbriimonadaceae bacterium]|nr:Mur ligase domain-containing protein [Fimbriimonadaceae bacterium]
MRRREELARFSPTESLADARRLVMVGVGGAGMTALARLLRSQGRIVAGVDRSRFEAADDLEALGVELTFGHREDAVQPGDALILTDAIDLDASPEVAAARRLGCPIVRRSQALAFALKGLKTVCVAGTHGKTTTAWLVVAGLRAAGRRVHAVIGAGGGDGVPELEDGADWAVVEACEAYEAYLDLDPDVAVLTNVEADHLDYHGDYGRMLESYRRFLARLRPGGRIVASEQAARELGLDSSTSPELTCLTDEIYDQVSPVKPGRIFRENAGLAWMACQATGADAGAALTGVNAFTGPLRRLEIRSQDPLIIVDYAHMPTEIDGAIQACREGWPDRNIVAVFQPHLYTRTRDNLEGFARSLLAADEIVLTDIYPAREAPMPGMSSLRIVELIPDGRARYVPSRHRLPRALADLAGEASSPLFLLLGAGDIDRMAIPTRDGLAARAHRRPVVVWGGETGEREVSGHSARAVAQALEGKADLLDLEELLFDRNLSRDWSGPNRPSLIINMAHGGYGENGSLAGLAAMFGIPMTGCGQAAAALTIDKQKTKDRLASAGIDVPKGLQVLRGGSVPAEIPMPCVVKPAREGSTVGLSFVRTPEELPGALARAWKADESVL